MMKKIIAKIGVFDSGVGGLTVLRALVSAFPNAEFFYLGDTARTPYGSKSADVVRRYALEAAQFFIAQQIDLFVVACNTVSSIALTDLKEALPCPVIGTIEPAINAWLKLGGPTPTGIIGTSATVRSEAYQSLIGSSKPNTDVIPRACPLFVSLVEEGIVEGSIVDSIIEYYLSDVRAENIKSLFLACTHYPLLKSALTRFFGHNLHLIDSADAIAGEVAKNFIIDSVDRDISALNHCHYFVTDDVDRFNRMACKIMGLGQVSAEFAKLSSLEADCSRGTNSK